MKYDWKKFYSMCHNRIRNQQMRNIRRGMQKQVPMTISYFMPLVTKIFIFLGDDEVIGHTVDRSC